MTTDDMHFELRAVWGRLERRLRGRVDDANMDFGDDTFHVEFGDWRFPDFVDTGCAA